MNREKRPFYKKKRWYIIFFAAMFIFYSIGVSVEDAEEEKTEKAKQERQDKKEEKKQEKKQKKEEKEDKSKKQDDQKENKEKTDQEEKAVEKEKSNDIELDDDELLFGEYTVENIEVEIENDELTLSFDWINQSGKEDVPFTALGYFDVTQGDEILDETSGAYDPKANSLLLKKIHNGGTMPAKAVFEIKNDDPIEIKFGATHEIDNTKEKLVIEDWN